MAGQNDKCIGQRIEALKSTLAVSCTTSTVAYCYIVITTLINVRKNMGGTDRRAEAGSPLLHASARLTEVSVVLRAVYLLGVS